MHLRMRNPGQTVVALACLLAGAIFRSAAGHREDLSLEGLSLDVNKVAAKSGFSALTDNQGDLHLGRSKTLPRKGALLQASAQEQSAEFPPKYRPYFGPLFEHQQDQGAGTHSRAFRVKPEPGSDLFKMFPDVPTDKEVVLKVSFKTGTFDSESMTKECNVAKQITTKEHELGYTTSSFMRCYGVSVDQPFLYSILEVAGDKEVFDAFADTFDSGGFDLITEVRIVKQVLEGLRVLSRMDPPLIHHDLKLENLMVDKGLKDVRIIDYGYLQTTHTKVLELRGTKGYFPPELYGYGHYGMSWSWDVYSLGMMILVMEAQMVALDFVRDVLDSVVDGLECQNLIVFEVDKEQYYFPEDVSVEYFDKGIMFPIHINNDRVCTAAEIQEDGSFKTADEEKVFTIREWLEVAAQESKMGEFWKAHKEVLVSMLNDDPRQRPSPEHLLELLEKKKEAS